MIRWREAYERERSNKQFIDYFGKAGKSIDMSAFRPMVYAQIFTPVAAGSTTGGATPTTAITPGAATGPLKQTFDNGAIILGITASANQQQTTTSSFSYGPSQNPGRRDLFALDFQYTGDEVLVKGGPVIAEALLGSGLDTIFPSREILIPSGSGLLATVVALTLAPPLRVDVCYHCMVPRFQ